MIKALRMRAAEPVHKPDVTGLVVHGRTTHQDVTPVAAASGFRHDFSRMRVHADASNSRGPAPGDDDPHFIAGNARPEGEDEVHRGMTEAFRERQGQPPGGVDEQRSQVGPTDAEIKYRAQPIAVLNGPFHAPIDTPAKVGMAIQITVQWSASNRAELAFVQDSEVVSPSLDHTGSFAALPPIVGSTSGFMAALNIPNDLHRIGRAFVTDRADNHGGSGSISIRQLDIYNHARQGIFSPLVIPNSGYKVTQAVIAGPGTRLVLTATKAPEACTIGEHSTTAGPSPTQSDSVVLRA
jgi:hypothetical protein